MNPHRARRWCSHLHHWCLFQCVVDGAVSALYSFFFWLIRNYRVTWVRIRFCGIRYEGALPCRPEGLIKLLPLFMSLRLLCLTSCHLLVVVVPLLLCANWVISCCQNFLLLPHQVIREEFRQELVLWWFYFRYSWSRIKIERFAVFWIQNYEVISWHAPVFPLLSLALSRRDAWGMSTRDSGTLSFVLRLDRRPLAEWCADRVVLLAVHFNSRLQCLLTMLNRIPAIRFCNRLPNIRLSVSHLHGALLLRILLASDARDGLVTIEIVVDLLHAIPAEQTYLRIKQWRMVSSLWRLLRISLTGNWSLHLIHLLEFMRAASRRLLVPSKAGWKHAERRFPKRGWLLFMLQQEQILLSLILEVFEELGSLRIWWLLYDQVAV